MPETRAARRLPNSSEAICPELQQQSSHQCDQSSTPGCGDGVFSDKSEDNMFCTCASPPPLPLLSSTFGIHLSSLNKFNSSDGAFKLSGYIRSLCLHSERDTVPN